jgi:hypothetical protein
MTRLKLPLLLLLIIHTSFSVHAQKPGATLAQQYNDVVMRSGSYQGFKEIRQDKLDLFWKNISDTLAKERQLLTNANAKLLTNAQDVIKSKVELDNTQQELAGSRASVNQVSLLGIPLEKGTYSLMMWGLVLLLAAALTFAIYRNKSAANEARYRTELYNELAEEFQKHKVNANEKEKKLARELQTERNLIEEMKGR